MHSCWAETLQRKYFRRPDDIKRLALDKLYICFMKINLIIDFVIHLDSRQRSNKRASPGIYEYIQKAFPCFLVVVSEMDQINVRLTGRFARSRNDGSFFIWRTYFVGSPAAAAAATVYIKHFLWRDKIYIYFQVYSCVLSALSCIIKKSEFDTVNIGWKRWIWNVWWHVFFVSCAFANKYLTAFYRCSILAKCG